MTQITCSKWLFISKGTIQIPYKLLIVWFRLLFIPCKNHTFIGLLKANFLLDTLIGYTIDLVYSPTNLHREVPCSID